jgi:hypothetical protein
MPRESQAAMAVTRIGSSVRLAPPAELGEAEVDVFRRTVAAVPAGHFLPEDLDLLAAHARVTVLERQAAAALGEAIASGGKVGVLAAAHSQVSRALMNLVVRLRLGPRARDPTHRRRSAMAVKQGGGALSYYEIMDLDGDADAESGSRGAAAGNSNGEG